jgi:hypothetical protein
MTSEVLVAEPVTVVDLVPASLVWRILRRYAHAQPGAGSQLNAMGVGRGTSFAGRDCACSVAQKLQRAPLIERALWYGEAAGWIRDQEGYRDRRAAGELARLQDPRLIQAAMHFAWNADRCVQESTRMSRTRAYREQFALLVVELSACWADDPAFRAWIDNVE